MSCCGKILHSQFSILNYLYYLCSRFPQWSDARVAEEARLESVCAPKAYPEFESRSLRTVRAVAADARNCPV